MEKIRFEEDYIFRNNRQITSVPDIALTELVANSWDAGAQNVEIILPAGEGETRISISDDGCGMSRDEFLSRWMTLNYNREKHQGKFVSFPEGSNSTNTKRIAYGRNGVGRHGMLCFSNNYTVETWKNGHGNRYDISISAGEEPYRIVSEQEITKEGHGTVIYTNVDRNKPKIDEIKEILSARFIYDPQFSLMINGNRLTLSSNSDVVKQEHVVIENGVELDISIVDSTKTAPISKRHGVAFWIGGRLVGNPSWSYGKHQFMDARYRIAKRYTVIVQAEDERVINDVLPDWTGFLDTPLMNQVFNKVNDVIKSLVTEVMSESIIELKKEVIEDKRPELNTLSIARKREVSSFIDYMTDKNPLIDADFLGESVEALLNIQQAKNGSELLSRLGSMSPDELDNLTNLLRDWDINDIVSVIDEIDNRILVIEAISRIYEDTTTEELRTLHPLVLNSKWLFGAEYDSPMYTSNKALSTVVKELFKEDEFDLSVITNSRKRPDIVCLHKSIIRVVCTEKADERTSEIMKPDQILIIELKRGGFEIGYAEVNQAENYVRQIKKSMVLHRDAKIHAFVVGAKIGDVSAHRETEEGIVDIVTYGQLVQTARVKLFGLRDKLEEHYNSIDDKSLVEKALAEPRQQSIFDN